MFGGSASNDERVYFDDPDPQLHITLKFPNRAHPHSVYKVEKTCLRKLSRFFSKSFDLFNQSGALGVQSIEISQPINHEAFDACMRYMCFTRFLTDEKSRFEFDQNLTPELLEVSHYLEIEELKTLFLQRILSQTTLIEENSVWRFLSVAFYLPTDRGYEKNEKIKEKVFTYLKNGNFLTLKKIKGQEGILNKIPQENFVYIFVFHNSEKIKNQNKSLFLKNEDIIALVEIFAKQKFEDNKEQFKKTIKDILMNTLQKNEMNEEENLIFTNFELFYVISEYKRFEDSYKTQIAALLERLKVIERSKFENQDYEIKRAEEINQEKKGIKNELLTRLSSLEKEKAVEKLTLQSRIEKLEKENAELRKEVSKVFEQMKNTMTKDFEDINGEMRSTISDLENCRRIEIFKLVDSSNILTVKAQKRIINWIKAMQARSGILDTMGKMIIGSNSTSVLLEMVYQASRDGMDAKCFHDKCDTLRNTVVVIQSEHGKIFGGYTSNAAWQSMGMYAPSDSQAFIFSIDHKICMPVTDVNKAIYNHSNYGPTFGGGNEIFVSQKFGKDLGSHANINGTSYEKPILDDNLKIETFMGGSFHFKITEIEIYQAKFA